MGLDVFFAYRMISTTTSSNQLCCITASAKFNGAVEAKFTVSFSTAFVASKHSCDLPHLQSVTDIQVTRNGHKRIIGEVCHYFAVYML